MEHAIRKHCTVHFDEDPAFYKRLSEKLERLIKQHQDNWTLLATEYEKLRQEAIDGRKESIEGLSIEASTFYDYVSQLALGEAGPSDAPSQSLKDLMLRIVQMLRETINVLDFWKKPIEVKKLRGRIDTEILLADIPELNKIHERIAVEIVKLAEKRHGELTR